MRKIYCYMLTALVSVGFVCSCSQSDDDGAGLGGSDSSATLIGLWSGQTRDTRVHVYDLREDGTAVVSRYSTMFGAFRTETYSGWSARNGVLRVGSDRLYCRPGHIEMLDPSTFDKVPLIRKYIPILDKGALDIPRLTYYTWTGYYEDRVVTLEFNDDGTMIRQEEPNDGYEGETFSTIYEWSVSNNVIRFAGHDGAWGVTVEEDFEHGSVIFVDFGDLASAFRENKNI